MLTRLFEYGYPRSRIAVRPCAARDEARLLVLGRRGGRVGHRRFKDIVSYLKSGDCLVLNDTRVMPVRFEGRKATGGRVGILLSKPVSKLEWEALIRPGRVRPGAVLKIGNGKYFASVLGLANGEASARVKLSRPLARDLFKVGSIPLPPYMKRAPNASDRKWYQTVYAREAGSIAAPTAGLHFTKDLLRQIKAKGVSIAYLTCHIGYASFRPVRSNRIEDHVMHTEHFSVPASTVRALRAAKKAGQRVVAVGTSSTRVLEELGSKLFKASIRSFRGATQLFIKPPFRFNVVDALITNFHMPRTTLVMLVSAFAGRVRLLQVYKKAVRKGYRLFSYGDAMFIR
ncbi:MAG: tRNA preQ1(34) S-adenosylmethionine ribosyltransferase-isomerase QueA [Candidatus Omnitrophica bacterium]|nr:tRNA preQ1(34) S-adenosylmethionine ribosyltransferase-isomerase QueA [Candidatus Omnitrophota bacterium]